MKKLALIVSAIATTAGFSPAEAGSFALVHLSAKMATFVDQRRLERSGAQATVIQEVVFPEALLDPQAHQPAYALAKMTFDCESSAFMLNGVGYYDMTGQMISGSTKTAVESFEAGSPGDKIKHWACFNEPLPAVVNIDGGTTALAQATRASWAKIKPH